MHPADRDVRSFDPPGSVRVRSRPRGPGRRADGGVTWLRVAEQRPTESVSAAWSDAELARAVANPALARAAEALLAERLSKRLRLVGLRHFRSDDGAAELVQRTLLVVLTSLRSGQVHDVERIGGYALGVARRVVLEMQRGARRAVPVEDVEATAAARAQDASATEPMAIARRQLESALGALPERERAVLLLTYHSDLDAPEIAERLGMEASHVRVVRHRALAALRETLGVEQPQRGES